MIDDSRTDTVYFSDKLERRHPALFQELTSILEKHQIRWGIIERTRDIWARDYMPIQIERGRFVKFRYEPDYLRGYEQLRTGNEVLDVLEGKGQVKKSDLVVDGGNVVSLGSKVAMTAKVYKENPRVSPGQLRTKLCEELEVDEVVIIPREPWDVVGHSDGVLRIVEEGRVATNTYKSEEYRPYRRRLLSKLKRVGLEVEFVPHVVVPSHTDIPSAKGLYLNWLRVGKLLIVPVFGLPEDDSALRSIERIFSDLAIETVCAEDVSEEGGVLNCIAWNIEDAHKPEPGQQEISSPGKRQQNLELSKSKYG